MITEHRATYHAADALFGELLGRGVVTTVTSLDDLSTVDSPHATIVLGSLGFSPADDHLVVPREVLTLSAFADHSVPISAPSVARENPDETTHRASVAEIVSRIERGELEKAVLARVVDLEFPEPLDPAAVVHNLAVNDPVGRIYAMPVGDGATILGASPELLVSRRGRTVRSHPLAGSAPRHTDPLQDKENAQQLRSSGKDLAEHALVVDAVRRTLEPYCTSLRVPSVPSLVATPTMWHLGTEISGELATPAPDALTLARALHPTPAVGGTPTEAALSVISELEPFDRQCYAGAVGWTDANGDGEWAVTIRCGLLRDEHLRLYAGGGIVAGSDPATEWAETTAKLRTVGQALGLVRR